MKFFEVFIELLTCAGTSIGKTILHVEASSMFEAASKAEKLIDADYCGNILSHAIKIQQIPKAEYNFNTAA